MHETRTHRGSRRPGAALLAVCLAAGAWPCGVRADDGNLTHRLEADQRRSSFERKLEQIRERARARAEQTDERPAFTVERPDPPPGYHGSQRLRLTPLDPGDAERPEALPRRDEASDVEERAERRERQLHESQRRRALTAETPPAAERPGRAEAEARHEQRKLRSEQRAESFHRKLMR